MTRDDLNDLVGKLEASPYADRLRDDQQRRSELFRRMAESNDPTWREIGKQLQRGQITPRDALTSESYRDHVGRGIARSKEAFPKIAAYLKQRLDDAG